MDVKEIRKVILVNILMLLCIFCISELYFYNRTAKQMVHGGKNNKLPYFNLKDKDYALSTIWESRYRPYDKNFKSYKKPIMILGCSYAWGLWLEEEDTMSEQLKSITSRWTYNLGTPGGGPYVWAFNASKNSRF